MFISFLQFSEQVWNLIEKSVQNAMQVDFTDARGRDLSVNVSNLKVLSKEHKHTQTDDNISRNSKTNASISRNNRLSTEAIQAVANKVSPATAVISPSSTIPPAPVAPGITLSPPPPPPPPAPVWSPTAAASSPGRTSAATAATWRTIGTTDARGA